MRIAGTIIILAATLLPGSASAERYCSFSSSGVANCAYATIEQCRAAATGMGRCSPQSWLGSPRPARRAAARAPDSDGYPRMSIDPPSHVPDINANATVDRHNMGW
jgi:hypothetical protein